MYLLSISLTSYLCFFFFFSSRRRHTRSLCDWSSDVCSSDLEGGGAPSCTSDGEAVLVALAVASPESTRARSKYTPGSLRRRMWWGGRRYQASGGVCTAQCTPRNNHSATWAPITRARAATGSCASADGSQMGSEVRGPTERPNPWE